MGTDTTVVAAAGLGLAPVRRRLIEWWNPVPPSAQLSPDEAGSLCQLWSELRRVEAVGAWRATIALAGQVIEAHLKQRLVLGGRPRTVVAKMTMHPLIEAAIADGVFRDGTRPSAADTMFIAKQLRNWASHGSVWARSPGERQASNVIAMLIAYSELCFPTDHPQPTGLRPLDSPEWWHTHVDTVEPYSAGRAISRFAQQAALSPALFTTLGRRWLAAAAPISVYRLIRNAEIAKLKASVVANLLREQFPVIVANSARGSVDDVERVVHKLNRLRLRTEASLLAACVPRTSEALAYYLAKAPMRFSMYLTLVRQADPAEFKQWAMDAGRPALTDAVRRLIDQQRGDLTNLSLILGSLPASLAAAIVQDNRDGITSWVADANPWHALDLCRTLLQPRLAVTETAASTAVEIVGTLAARAKREPLTSFSTLIFKLHGDGLLGMPTFSPLVDALYARAAEAEDPERDQQILWDLINLAPDRRVDAMTIAQRILDEHPDWPLWYRLCLTGALRVGGAPVPPVPHANVEKAVADVHSHYWQQLLVLYACSRVADARKKTLRRLAPQWTATLKPQVDIRAAVGVKIRQTFVRE